MHPCTAHCAGAGSAGPSALQINAARGKAQPSIRPAAWRHSELTDELRMLPSATEAADALLYQLWFEPQNSLRLCTTRPGIPLQQHELGRVHEDLHSVNLATASLLQEVSSVAHAASSQG